MSGYNCAICGRALTDPESIRIGIGPICLKKRREHHLDRAARRGIDRYLDYPITKAVRLRRASDGAVETNVPHIVTHHSPDGYEFGYAGSGPSDLALNLCEVFLRRLGYSGSTVEVGNPDKVRIFRLAWDLKTECKERFISGAPRDGYDIPHEQLEAWFRSKISTRGEQGRLAI